MKKYLPVLLIILLAAIALYFILQQVSPDFLGKNGMSRSNQNALNQAKNKLPNKNNCLGDDCLQVDNLNYPVSDLSSKAKEALGKAIDDEYKAQATYQKVIDKFGQIRPFAMIIGAEGQHIASLKALYDKYGMVPPPDQWSSRVEAPASIQESCAIGIEAEIANANLYKDELLPAVKDYEDITMVFTNLMNASEQRHLPAFRRCSGK